MGDFEILLGNDDPGHVVDEENIGLSDERIRIFNHQRNLGERNNLNFLLAHSRGRYFTWLADDDAYFDTFLATVYKAFEGTHNLPVAFTSYLAGEVPLNLRSQTLEVIKS